jgi:hypothetical protein
MKQLIEDYNRRLDSINQMIESFNSNGSINDIRKDERLKTKASEYRTFIAEMERELDINREFKESAKPEESIFEWDLPRNLVPEVEEVEANIWLVPVCRIGFGHRTIEVIAKTEQEAIKLGIDFAIKLSGYENFIENDAKYSAPEGAHKKL